MRTAGPAERADALQARAEAGPVRATRLKNHALRLRSRGSWLLPQAVATRATDFRLGGLDRPSVHRLPTRVVELSQEIALAQGP